MFLTFAIEPQVSPFRGAPYEKTPPCQDGKVKSWVLRSSHARGPEPSKENKELTQIKQPNCTSVRQYEPDIS